MTNVLGEWCMTSFIVSSFFTRLNNSCWDTRLSQTQAHPDLPGTRWFDFPPMTWALWESPLELELCCWDANVFFPGQLPWCGRSMGLWKNTDGSVASRHLGLDLVCFGIVDDQNCPHQKQPLKWRPKFSTPTPMQCTQQSLLSECLPQCLRNESLVFLRIDIYDMLSLDVIGCALGFRFWTWTPRFN